MHNFHFDSQYNSYHGFGTAIAPEGQGIVGVATAEGESLL